MKRRIAGGGLLVATLLLSAACGSGSGGTSSNRAEVNGKPGAQATAKPEDSAATASPSTKPRPVRPMAKVPPGVDVGLLFKGTLRVCQGPAGDPFFRHVNPKSPLSGAMLREQGFDVDLLDLVGQRLGVQASISEVQTDLPSEFTELTSGQVFQNRVCDIIAGFSADTPTAFPDLSFTIPYFTDKQAILAKQGAGYTSLAALAGKRVGAMDTGMRDDLDTYDSAHGQTIHVTRLRDRQVLYAQLRQGQLDAVVVSDAQALNAVAEHPEWGLAVAGTFGTAYRHMFAVKKGSSALLGQVNAALADAGGNGQYAKAYRRWFGDEPLFVPGAG